MEHKCKIVPTFIIYTLLYMPFSKERERAEKWQKDAKNKK